MHMAVTGLSNLIDIVPDLVDSDLVCILVEYSPLVSCADEADVASRGKVLTEYKISSGSRMYRLTKGYTTQKYSVNVNTETKIRDYNSFGKPSTAASRAFPKHSDNLFLQT